jgi:hypothetical protein
LAIGFAVLATLAFLVVFSELTRDFFCVDIVWLLHCEILATCRSPIQ